MGGGKTNTSSSSETGITDKAGVTDKVWKPTALDEVKPEGAPGAGPSAPDYKPATPDLSSSASSKPAEPAVRDVAKDSTPSESTHTSSAPKQSQSHSEPEKHSVGDDIDAILESTPKSKHTVDDREANDPHSKMTGTTVRQTEASQHGETDNSKSMWTQKAGHLLRSADGIAGLATEKAGARSQSNASADPTSSTGDEKNGKKMSQLTNKLKDKLHIGSKDK